MATTFNHPTTSTPIHLPSYISSDLTQSELLSFPAFKLWHRTIVHSLSLQSQQSHVFHSDPYALRSLTITSLDRFRNNKLGFVKLTADVRNGADESLPGIALLRGGAVAMMVILQPDDVDVASETDKHVLLTIQPRVPAGSLGMVELPAGMLDDSGSFSGVAAKEIEEEVGLTIPSEELLDMTSLALGDGRGAADGEELQKGIYMSAGGQDEFIAIFLHQRRVKREELETWSGRLTGERDHGEKITLKCVRLENLWKEAGRDAKSLAAWTLYEGLRKEGKLKGTGSGVKI